MINEDELRVEVLEAIAQGVSALSDETLGAMDFDALLATQAAVNTEVALRLLIQVKIAESYESAESGESGEEIES